MLLGLVIITPCNEQIKKALDLSNAAKIKYSGYSIFVKKIRRNKLQRIVS